MKGLLSLFLASIWSARLIAVEPVMCVDFMTHLSQTNRLQELISIRGRTANAYSRSLMTSFEFSSTSAFSVAGDIETAFRIFPLDRAPGEDVVVAGHEIEGSGIELLDDFLERLGSFDHRRVEVIIEGLGILVQRANQMHESDVQLIVGDFLISKVFPLVEQDPKRFLKPTLKAMLHAASGTRINELLLSDFAHFVISYIDHKTHKALAIKALKRFGTSVDEQTIRKLYDIMERSPFAGPPSETRWQVLRRQFMNIAILGFSATTNIPTKLLQGPPPTDIAIIRLWEQRQQNSARIREILEDVQAHHPNEKTKREAGRVLQGLEQAA